MRTISRIPATHRLSLVRVLSTRFFNGLMYGMIAYLGMNYLVVPLSAIGRRSAQLQIRIFLTEIIGHAFLVGLPLGLLARQSAKKNGRDFRNSASAASSLNPSDI